MLSFWTIKLLHAALVCCIGVMALWLFIAGITDRRGKKGDLQREESRCFAAYLTRKGKPYCRIDLNKGVYSVGAEKDCDIMLMGGNIPPKLGEMVVNEDECSFRSETSGHVCFDGDSLQAHSRKRLREGDRLNISVYEMLIEK